MEEQNNTHIQGTSPLRRDSVTGKVYFLGKEVSSMAEAARLMHEFAGVSTATVVVPSAKEPPADDSKPVEVARRFRVEATIGIEFEFTEQIGEDELCAEDQAFEQASDMFSINNRYCNHDLNVVRLTEIK